jgi:sugar phosphate isomerase/epimerase
LDKHGVTIGIQNHCDACVASAMGIRHLIEKYTRKQFGAVLDAAHTALNGEDPELAIDICWSHLCMVNLKNAFWRPATGPEAPFVRWEHYWTAGRYGLANWSRYAVELKRRGYQGWVCLTAEYSDQAAVDRLIAEDIVFAKGLFA